MKVQKLTSEMFMNHQYKQIERQPSDPTMCIWQGHALANAESPRIVFECLDEFQHLFKKNINQVVQTTRGKKKKDLRLTNVD